MTAGLVLGLLDTSARVGDADLAGLLRDLTVSWSRFKYGGDLIEDDDVDRLLQRAADAGHRRCLVQAHGHLLQEVWRPGAEPFPDFLHGLDAWLEGRTFLAAGRPHARDGAAVGLDDRCLVVDLDQYRRLGRPRFREAPHDPPSGGLVRRAAAHGVPVLSFPEQLEQAAVDLHPSGAPPLDPRVAPPSSGEPPAAAAALAGLRQQAERLRDGVFPWNLESYDDVRPEAPGAPPLRVLYSVAAGLKPNFLLHTLGCDAETRVVFFDYSEPGLAFRALLHREWDGEDYPRFLRHAFARLGDTRAHFCLWDAASPAAVDWVAMDARWQRELAAWGGAAVLREHWRVYRALRQEQISCDVMTDPGPLLARVDGEPGAIWWSNAFFTVPGNLRLRAPERRQRYRRFVEGLASRAPDLLLHGASSDNVPVNGVRAGEYGDWFARHGGDELRPGRRHAVALRF